MIEPESALALIESPKRNGDRPPGYGLTALQKQVAELIVTTGASSRAIASRFPISDRSVRKWHYDNEDFRRYLDYLTTRAVQTAQRTVRATLSRHADAAANRLAQLATSHTVKPPHAYQVEAAKAVLERVAGKPSQSQELGVKVPTEHGDVVIVWRSGHDPSIGGTVPDHE